MHYPSTMRNIKPGEKGFTLVEVLVSISILLVVILGPMTIAQKGMQNAYFASERVTAVFLAQEAMEYFEHERNEAALQKFRQYTGGAAAPDTWAKFRDNTFAACRTNNGCDVDLYAGTVHECSDASDCNLKKYVGNTTHNRMYGYYTGWGTSPFTRKIHLDTPPGIPLASTEEVAITIEVTWTGAGAYPRTVVLQGWLHDIYDRYN